METGTIRAVLYVCTYSWVCVCVESAVRVNLIADDLMSLQKVSAPEFLGVVLVGGKKIEMFGGRGTKDYRK